MVSIFNIIVTVYALSCFLSTAGSINKDRFGKSKTLKVISELVAILSFLITVTSVIHLAMNIIPKESSIEQSVTLELDVTKNIQKKYSDRGFCCLDKSIYNSFSYLNKTRVVADNVLPKNNIFRLAILFFFLISYPFLIFSIIRVFEYLEAKTGVKTESSINFIIPVLLLLYPYALLALSYILVLTKSAN